MEVETQGGGCLDLFVMALGVVSVVLVSIRAFVKDGQTVSRAES